MFGTGFYWIVILVIPFFALVPDITLRLFRAVLKHPWENLRDPKEDN